MINDLFCNDVDDCQPTAINLYFNKKLFNSTKKYNEKQYRLNMDLTASSLHTLDRNLSSFVMNGNHLLKRKLLFTSERNWNIWPPKIKTIGKKFVAIYGKLGEIGHMECFKLRKNQIISLRTGKIAIAFEVEDNKKLINFILDSQKKNSNTYFLAYVFKRVNVSDYPKSRLHTTDYLNLLKKKDQEKETDKEKEQESEEEKHEIDGQKEGKRKENINLIN